MNNVNLNDHQTKNVLSLVIIRIDVVYHFTKLIADAKKVKLANLKIYHMTYSKFYKNLDSIETILSRKNNF